jgi:hypothetical protein
MLKSRKGFAEVMALVWVAAIVVGGLVTWLAGPALVKSVGSLANGGDKNQQKIVHKVDKQRTYFELDEKTGKYVPAFTDKTSEYSNELQATQPPETLWEKFWKIGVMAVVIIVVLSYLGILPIIRLWWSKKIKPKIDQAYADLEAVQVKHDELTGEAQMIVESVDVGLATMDANISAAQTMVDAATDPAIKNSYTTIVSALRDMKQDFLDALSKKQDSTTKKLVAQLKND